MKNLSGPDLRTGLVGDTFSGDVTLTESLRLTRQGVIAADDIETFYELYSLAFDHLKTLAFGRQVLTRAEFVSQMTDDRVWKYVAWTAEDEPVGLTTLTRALETVPWISPDYFRAHYPEQWSRNAVYYLGFTLCRPDVAGGTRAPDQPNFLETLIQIGIGPLITERGVIAYDVCRYNNETLNLPERIAEVLNRHSDARAEVLDTQVYYGVSFR